MQITFSGVSYAYPGTSKNALEQLSAVFPEGWTGVVGPNGAGKSTVARLACGLLEPTAGTVAAPGRPVCAYCEQQVLALPDGAFDLACDWTPAAVRLRSLLGVEDDWAWRFDTLSAGERKRLQLACALAGEPDVLALDEPTNFLDAPTRELVARALEGFAGVGLLVSHDRALLDRLAQRCLFVEAGRGQMRPGGYTAGSGQAELERASSQAQRDQARRELARLERERTRRVAEADKATKNRSKRGLDPHDHDAREKIGRYIYSGQDGRRARQSTALDGRIAATRADLEANVVAKRYDGDVWLETEPSRRNALARLGPCLIPMGEDRALQVPALTLGPTDHVGVVGPNGAGKTTLVNALLEQVSPDLPLLVLPQELDEGQASAFLARVKAMPSAQLGRALSIVAQLGSRPDAVLQGASTSPGELRKLMLAEGLTRAPQLIVFDEPTNHLDVTSIEALQRVLAACPCALVLVSHDAPFVEATTNTRWSVARGADGTGSVDVR